MKKQSYILSVFLGILYFYFAYSLQRADFFMLFGLYSALFLGSLYFYKILNDKLEPLFVLSIVFRLIFLVAIPNLSQDFYRFIWDGRMLLEGLNPYLSKPLEYISQENFSIVNQAKELYNGMGDLNASHYTNYPPLNQFFFALAALFSPNSILGSVVVFRLVIILSDVGVYFIGKKLLKKLGRDPKTIFWYLLNPFVIIEMTGNLHFESVMVFFLLLSIYLITVNKKIKGSFAFSASILLKLMPLLFLPVFLRYFKFKKLFVFYLLVGLVTLAGFLPFLSLDFFTNYLASVGLWFNNFEFNASFYYLFRQIGFWVEGYNTIAIIGKITPVFVVIFILIRSLLKRNLKLEGLLLSMLYIISVWYFTTSTMHPWYLAIPLILSVLVGRYYILLWTFTIMLSYFSYRNNLFNQNYYILLLEYLPVYFLFIYEFLKANSSKNNLKK